MNKTYNYVDFKAPRQTLQEESDRFPFAVLSEIPGVVDDDTRNELADIKLFDMYLPNFSMRISQGMYKHDVLLCNPSAVGIEYMGSCLFLEGNVKTRLSIDTNTVESPVGTQNFKFDPNNELRHWLPANVPFRIAHFTVSPDYFLQFLPDGEIWSEKLKTSIIRRERVLGMRTPAISFAQAQALQLILNCPIGGKLGQTMMETAIVQIMLMNLHALFQMEETQQTGVSQKDRNMANAVMDHIEKTYLADQTLNDLTKHFGTNTNKLMSVFKKVFDKSIFEYIGELRMKHAHDLLITEDLTVTEVSKLVGYKNPNHFSAAFKKKYGVSPVKVGC